MLNIFKRHPKKNNIPEVPTFKQNLQACRFVYAGKQLITREDRLFELKQDGIGSKMKLVEEEEDSEARLAKDYEDWMKSVTRTLENSLDLQSPEEQELLKEAVQAILQEEEQDMRWKGFQEEERPPWRPRRCKQNHEALLERLVQRRMEEAQSDSSVEIQSSLQQSIICKAKRLKEDLLKVVTWVSSCYPEQENVCQFYATLYHKTFSARLREVAEYTLCDKDCVLLLQWVNQDYPYILNSGKIKDVIDHTKLDPLLPEDMIAPLEQQFLITKEMELSTCLHKILDREETAWKEGELPQLRDHIYQGKKKYIKLNGASYPEFLREAKEKFSIPPETNIYVLDDSGTEVDEEVFSDILEEKSDILWTIVNVLSVSDSPVQSSCTDTLSLSSRSSDSDASLMSPKRQRIDDAFVMSPKSLQTDDSSSQAKELVKRILEQKPGGEKILAKYAMTGEMKDRARRDLVSIVVAEMFDKYGRAPPMEKRAQYALGIVTLFPSLKDPYSKKGYEHFFDIDSNEGYIAWKIKNTQRELSNGGTSGGRRRSSHTTNNSGPNLEREVTKVQQLEGDQCREAISLLKHTTDNEQIFLKMRETFQHRQKLIHDPEQCSTVLTVFPRFLDTKGLVVQDFDLLFGAETSSKLLEKWDFLKGKVIEQAKDLSKTPLLDHLIQSAEENTDEDDEVPGWDSDMASLLLLVYLLPPPPSGKKGAVKISTREAVDHVVKFHKSCRSLQEHSGPNQRRQPYILAVGTTRKHIHEYYIALDGDLLPCKGKSSLSAFDELFKAHYVFGISYDQALNGMYTFVQTTIYNIDVGHSHETPRVKDLRAKLLN